MELDSPVMALLEILVPLFLGVDLFPMGPWLARNSASCCVNMLGSRKEKQARKGWKSHMSASFHFINWDWMTWLQLASRGTGQYCLYSKWPCVNQKQVCYYLGMRYIANIRVATDSFTHVCLAQDPRAPKERTEASVFDLRSGSLSSTWG